MNYKQANIEICRQIIDGKVVRAQEQKGQWIEYSLIIPEPAYYGYFIKKDNIAFAMNKVAKLRIDVAHLENIAPENEIKPTSNLRIIDHKGKKMVRKFEAEGKEVWVQCDFLKNLEIGVTRFYQEKDNPNGIIIAAEYDNKVMKPVMVLLPMRFVED